VQRAVASISAQAAAKEIDMASTLPPEPCIVSADEFLLEKAILNLLQNAIAFAPRGGKVVAALQQQDGSCELRVEDNGPGIPDYAQPRVFERFFSLPRPDTGKKSSVWDLRSSAKSHRSIAVPSS
jgi:two-component system sensor histidine kinase CreC